MITLTKTLNGLSIAYPLEDLVPDGRLLFLDIETTGFTATTSQLYLIGCAYFENSKWQLLQWFAEKEDEETAVLSAFLEFAAPFSTLAHFNGTTFDLPFLKYKCKQHGLPNSLEGREAIDLYRLISPLKSFLKLEDCKQKTLERFLGIQREDLYSGGELVKVYQEFLKNPSEEARQLLLLHNGEDVQGMLTLLPLLAYYDLFRQQVTVKKAQSNHYRDLEGQMRQELLLTLRLPKPLPRPVTASAKGCVFVGEGSHGSLRVPILEGELKYFYSNYKDYYYLPEEDVALHKSVASFVDKEHRIQATAATCYTRKNSLYLPEWKPVLQPFFKAEYKSKELFFELTEELKQDRQAFAAYANHLLEMILVNCQ